MSTCSVWKRLGLLNSLIVSLVALSYGSTNLAICLSNRIHTLDLCLIDHKVLVVPTALKLLHMAAVKAQVLLLRLVEGEV